MRAREVNKEKKISSNKSVKSNPPRHGGGTTGPKERSASTHIEIAELMSVGKLTPKAFSQGYRGCCVDLE